MTEKTARYRPTGALFVTCLLLGTACSAEPESPHAAETPDAETATQVVAAKTPAATPVAETETPVVAAPTTAVTPVAGEPGPALYSVECSDDPETGGKSCTVDKKTFVGWRMYHAFCHVCHAQDAVGSTFAPSLVERLQIIDKARFIDVVANGYTGQIGVMPPWKDNPNISKRYEELYAYVKARSDGKLLPGRPKKKQ